MSVDYISALNKQGSGLNITQIVDSLVQAETAPLSGQIQRKIDQKNEAISGYALVAAELGKMKDYAASVKGSTAYSVSSDSSAVSVRIADQTQASDFSANLSVSALASAQTIEITGFSGKQDLVGTGSLSIDFGSWSSEGFSVNDDRSSEELAITDGNNTLADLADALNEVEGVKATVTNKGDGTYSLIINSATGQNNALRITASEDSDNTGLAALDNTVTNETKQVVAAADAQLNINGVQVWRTSNTITDLIDGYEFTLEVTSSAVAVSGQVDQTLLFSKFKICEYVQ